MNVPMIRYFSLALSVMAISTPALAQSRPDTRKMNCVGVRKLVETRKAIVLSTSDNAYDRYVANAGACNRGEEAVPAYAPTTDYTGCHIGYTCRQFTPGRR